MIRTFYHRSPAGPAIVAEGLAEPLRGVWLSDRPVDSNEGAIGPDLLRIELDLPDDQLAFYEIVEEDENGPLRNYREWLMPAEVVNRGRVVLLTPTEVRELGDPEFPDA